MGSIFRDGSDTLVGLHNIVQVAQAVPSQLLENKAIANDPIGVDQNTISLYIGH